MQVQQIMLVDDCTADAVIIRQAFVAAGFQGGWTIFHEFIGARSFLQGGSGGVRPDLIILDLYLPGGSGLDLLRYIKGDPRLRAVPVLILTGQDDPDTITACYEANAAAVMIKPVQLVRYMEDLRCLCGFWCGIVVTPSVPSWSKKPAFTIPAALLDAASAAARGDVSPERSSSGNSA